MQQQKLVTLRSLHAAVTDALPNSLRKSHHQPANRLAIGLRVSRVVLVVLDVLLTSVAGITRTS
jgi:hypothetical protein